ncbi:MAG: hypothetical protein ABW007_07205 [Chitinophagaceae bacterium]
MSRKALQSKRCPPKLAILIQRVNIFPPGVKFPVLNARSRLANFGGSEAEWVMRARFDLYDCLKEAPEEFRQFIYGDTRLQTPSFVETYSPALFDKTINAITRFEEFAELRKNLLRLVRFIKSLGLEGRADLVGVDVPLPVLSTPVIDKQGFIRIGGNALIEALRDVEANRLRECADCKRIFWAKRIDQSCCDPKTCGNRRRVRRSRDLQKEKAAEYKFNRIRK